MLFIVITVSKSYRLHSEMKWSPYTVNSTILIQHNQMIDRDNTHMSVCVAWAYEPHTWVSRPSKHA